MNGAGRYKPPCDACVADGVIRGALCGGVWGLFGFSEKIAPPPSTAGEAAAAAAGAAAASNKGRGAAPSPSSGRGGASGTGGAARARAPAFLRGGGALFRSNAIVPRTLVGAGTFALFMGAFRGFSCAVDGAVGGSLGAFGGQVASYGVGGFLAGLFIAPRDAPPKVRVRSALVFGAIAGGVTYLVGAAASSSTDEHGDGGGDRRRRCWTAGREGRAAEQG